MAKKTSNQVLWEGCVKSSIPARQLQPTWIKCVQIAVSYTGGQGCRCSKYDFKGEYVICGVSTICRRTLVTK
jgi:hypothetical protein